jgi:bacillithiol system protein YtxJ
MTIRTIETENDLEELLATSSERPVLLFKHSNACPISSRAHGEIERLLEGETDPKFGFGMVVVQKTRALSNAIEERFGVRHETPQAIVVRDGKAVWDASHFDVTRDRVAGALEAS